MTDDSTDGGELLGEARIEARFNGPRDSANGGYACGTLARFIPGPAEVTLRLPPPLEVDMEVRSSEEGGARLLLEDGTLVAEGGPADLEGLEPPVSPGYEDALEARASHPGLGLRHPMSDCFVCGPEREDGLGVSFGPLAGHDGIGAAPFDADESLASNGTVRPEIIWAVLDCPSFVPALWDGLRGEAPVSLLGRLAAERMREVSVGERLVAIGWPLSADDRKQHTASALLDEDGEPVARARATWIRLQA